MENFINFICRHFEPVLLTIVRDAIFQSLYTYFGIEDKTKTDTAVSDLDNAFITGTGINKAEIVPLGNGEYRFIYRQEFTIKAEYTGLIPVLANRLGYTEPVEPEALPEPVIEEGNNEENNS